MDFRTAIVVVMVCLLLRPFPVVARHSFDSTLWSMLAQKGIAAYKRRALGEAQQYLDLALGEAEKFKQPDVRLAGCLHMRAMLAGMVYQRPIAGAPGPQPPPTPPWGTVPPAPDLSLQGTESKPPTDSTQQPTTSTDPESLVRRALDICNKIPDVNQQFIANCQYDLARLQIARADYAGAESTLNKAVTICDTAGIKADLAQILFALGYVQDIQCKLAEADNSFSRAIEICGQQGRQAGCSDLPYMLRRRASYALWYERFDDAQLLLKKVILTSSHTNESAHNEVVAQSYFDLGCLQLMRESYSLALSHFQRALDFYQRTATPVTPPPPESSEVGGARPPDAPPTAGTKTQTLEKSVKPSRARRLHNLFHRPKQRTTKAPSKQDATLAPIPADEPVPAGGFPPLPDRLELPVPPLSGAGEPDASERPGDAADAFSPPLPLFQAPFYSEVAQVSNDTFSASDSFSASAPLAPPPIDITTIEVLESEKLSPDEILKALFQRSQADLQLHKSWYGCAYWPNEESTMRMIAMLLGKTRGQNAGVSMDAMANAVSGAAEYLPEDRAAKAGKKVMDDYAAALTQHIDRAWLPARAKSSKRIGLSLTVGQAGQLAGVTLTQPCGDGMLDQSAVKAISRAAPFAPPPAGLSTTQTVELVFEYHVLNLPGETLAPLRRVYLTAPPDWALDRQLYAQAVQSKIRRFWKVPAHSPPAQARVHLQVGPAGELLHVCIVRSSGNAAWDRTVISAVAEAGPFWQLPKSVGKDLETWLDFTSERRARKRATATIKIPVKPTGYTVADLTPYLRHVQQRIRLSFFPPVERKTEATIAKFKIRRDGSLTELRVHRSSGSIASDQESLKAIERACFYAPPIGAPENIEVEITFACGAGASWAFAEEPAANNSKTQMARTVIAKLDLESQLKPGVPSPKSSSAHDLVADTDVDFGPYLADLQRRIKRAWLPPTGCESKRVVVRFRVYQDGTISNLKLDRSSGMALSLSDQAALKAVESAAPFRTLPDGAPPVVDIQFTFDYNPFGDSNS